MYSCIWRLIDAHTHPTHTPPPEHTHTVQEAHWSIERQWSMELEARKGSSLLQVNTAYCIWSVIQSQSPISILLVSFPRNVAKETQTNRSSNDIWERSNDTPNATGCTCFVYTYVNTYIVCKWCIHIYTFWYAFSANDTCVFIHFHMYTHTFSANDMCIYTFSYVYIYFFGKWYICTFSANEPYNEWLVCRNESSHHRNTLQHTASPIMKDSSAETSPVMNNRLFRGKRPAREADETALPALKRSVTPGRRKKEMSSVMRGWFARNDLQGRLMRRLCLRWNAVASAVCRTY